MGCKLHRNIAKQFVNFCTKECESNIYDQWITCFHVNYKLCFSLASVVSYQEKPSTVWVLTLGNLCESFEWTRKEKQIPYPLEMNQLLSIAPRLYSMYKPSGCCSVTAVKSRQYWEFVLHVHCYEVLTDMGNTLGTLWADLIKRGGSQ